MARDGSYVRTAEIVKSLETAQGVEREGKIVLRFQSGTEQAEFVDVRVVRPDGSEHPVSADASLVQEAYPSPEAAVFTDLKLRTLVLPGLEPGSRAVSTTRLRREQPLFPGQFSALDWRSVHFRSPDIRWRYTLPREMPLHVDAQGATVAREELGDKVRWTVSARIDEAIPREPLGILALDYSPRVAVSTFADPGVFAATYRQMIEGRAAVTPAIQALADQLTTGIDEPREQARALYEWVARHIRYVAIHVGRGGWVPHAASTVLERRYGDCKDHTVLLGALLQAKGIASSPALLYAGLSWWLPQTTTPQAFNHMLLYVPGLDLYLDSTARFADFGVLPLESSGKPVLIVDGGRMARTPSVSHAVNRTETLQRITVADDGKLSGTFTSRAHGQAAIMERAIFTQTAAVPDAQFAAALMVSSGEHGTAQLRRPAVDTLGGPVESGLTYTLTRGLDLSRPDHLPVSRAVHLGGIHAFGRAALMAEGGSRRSPFLCVASDMTEEQTIHFPEKVQPGPLPEGKTFSTSREGLSYHFTTTYTRTADREVVIRRHLVVDAPRQFCDPSAYSAMQELGREIARAYGASVTYRPSQP